MDWILAKLPILIVVLVFAAKIFSAFANSKKAKRQHEAEHDPAEEQRRVAEIQEQIRRQIAARRQGTPARPAQPASHPMQRPIARGAETTAAPDPLGGGTIRRVFEEMERKLQPPSPPVEPPPLVQHRRAEFERQQQLADQMKALEEQRTLAQKRAAHAAEQQQAEAVSESKILSVARTRTLEDLRDPQAIRRAFILREVLGTPVGLR
jgi:hypothetical protein